MYDRHPLEDQDITAGRAAFAAGVEIQYNPHLDAMHGAEVPALADRMRFEAWRMGWLLASKGK